MPLQNNLEGEAFRTSKTLTEDREFYPPHSLGIRTELFGESLASQRALSALERPL